MRRPTAFTWGASSKPSQKARCPGGDLPFVRLARMPVLHVVAAAVLDPRGLLLVSKRSAPDVYFLPGGKPEDGESPRACLDRELREELGVGVARAEPFGDVRAPAALEPRELRMSVVLAALDGEPSPASEIASLAWWTEGQALELAPAVRDWVIPRLRRLGLRR